MSNERFVRRNDWESICRQEQGEILFFYLSLAKYAESWRNSSSNRNRADQNTRKFIARNDRWHKMFFFLRVEIDHLGSKLSWRSFSQVYMACLFSMNEKRYFLSYRNKFHSLYRLFQLCDRSQTAEKLAEGAERNVFSQARREAGKYSATSVLQFHKLSSLETSWHDARFLLPQFEIYARACRKPDRWQIIWLRGARCFTCCILFA